MAYPNTIQELTNLEYNELEYKISSTVTGQFIDVIKEVLDKCGFDSYTVGNEYGVQMQELIAAVQSKLGKSATGILNNSTWQAMLEYAENNCSDTINSDESATDDVIEETTTQLPPHHNPFFDDSNTKTHRKNGKDIKIVLGNNSVIKTLKNVYMRSVSVEVDTSGNPISEVYEFIAQDITESDEPMDANKYILEESNVDRKKVNYSYERVLG